MNFKTKPEYIKIYALQDPRTGKYYYVGRSANPSANRYSAHKNSTILKTSIELKSENLTPILVVLETVKFVDARHAEGQWIDRLKASGHPLENKSPIYSGQFAADRLQDMTDNPLSARFSEQQRNRLKYLIELLKKDNIGKIGVKEALLYAINVAIDHIESSRNSK